MPDDTTTDDVGTSRAEERIRSLSAERKQLREQLAELQSRYDQTQEMVKQADTYKATAAEWEQKFTQARTQWETERELFSRGITDQEGMDFVRMAYDRLPAEGRPALGEWLAGDKLPKAVRAYMPEASASAPAPTAPAVQTTPPPPANAGVTNAPSGAPSQYSAEAIQRMTSAEYKAARAAILGLDR
jgi:hypothetical protein